MVNYPKDSYGRPITNIRFSLTQKCNLDCIYCHNEGENQNCKIKEKRDNGEEITKEEVIDIVEVAKNHNIKKIKLTGGEPLLRDDLSEIMASISPYLKDLSITTNGTLLKEKIDSLVEAGLDRVNISLDSLDPDKFKKITGGNLQNVLDGIDAAIDSPLYPIKINTVILDGVNDDEIEDFIEFAKQKDVILQLIEFHDTHTLVNGENLFEKYHQDLEPLEEKLQERAERIDQRKMHHRKKYIFDGAEIEIVKPMHNTEFCRNCTRLRITSDGEFKPCLMRNDLNIDIDEFDTEKGFKKAIEKREPYFN